MTSFEIPIFPLNVVLFPGMPLPLHIFEPRYRLMIGRCLEADNFFGVALISEGVEGHNHTLPAPVGCTAQIIEVAPFADGRMNLHTIGDRRFRILELREEDEYLVGTVEWLDDEIPTDQTEVLAFQTRQILRRYLETLAQTGNAPEGEIEVPEDPYLLSMWAAAIMTLPNTQKQTLLEMVSTDTRLELEEFLLRRAQIVQLAYAKRLAQGQTEPPYDTTLGPMAQFASLN